MNIYLLSIIGVLIGTFVKLVIEWHKGDKLPTIKRISLLVVVSLFLAMFVPIANFKIKALAVQYLGMPESVNPIIQIASLFGLVAETVVMGFDKYVVKWVDSKINKTK